MSAPPAPPAASAATFAFHDLVAILDGVLAREASGLEALARMAAQRMAGNRDPGLGYAEDECRLAVAGLTELRATLADLVPHETTVRALIPQAA